MNSIRSDTLKGLELPCPNPEEAKAIEAIAIELASSISEEEQQLRKVRFLRDGAAGDLLTGRVRVPPDLDLS